MDTGPALVLFCATFRFSKGPYLSACSKYIYRFVSSSSEYKGAVHKCGTS